MHFIAAQTVSKSFKAHFHRVLAEIMAFPVHFPPSVFLHIFFTKIEDTTEKVKNHQSFSSRYA
jgi:hypothetical protein